ncbi:ABC transporter ATP-binding protein [Flectobacillus sp.]|uniref:ABC transporter ATP-binding protein n=1 Tax=Flectobacillus sp. TaxID=50419 RepID=UPI003BAB6F11
MINDCPVIEIENLTMNYGEKEVLKGLNLTINRGQIVGYIGPNGAGKSTTLKTLIGMVRGFSGKVKVLGFDVTTHSLEVKQKVGYVPESAQLYEQLTPMEYLLFVGRLHKMSDSRIEQIAHKMLEIFELGQLADRRMGVFSKGSKQKVQIIAGMMHNPDLIILDEPLSGLDPNAVLLLKEILGKLKSEGKTIFYSSHLMDVVEKISDRIILINQGEIVADGTFEDLQNLENSSLESIFSTLTGNSSNIKENAEQFLSLLKQS